MKTIRTRLYAEHQKLGARMTDFGGFEMPLQYTSILEEHRAVRTSAGLFDISHMGELVVRGREAPAFLEYLLTNRIGRLGDGKALYSPMCGRDGGILDDLLVYRLSPEEYMLVVNAGNSKRDRDHLREHATAFELVVEDRGRDTALLAVQGPDAEAVLDPLIDVHLASLPYFGFTWGRIRGIRALISRTGYTGEDGFEIFLDNSGVREVWRALLKGNPDRLKPAGLGARDTLRLEAGLPLYGRELHEGISPLAAGLEWTVDLQSKEEFIGRTALEAERREGIKRRPAGLRLLKPGIPRTGQPVLVGGGRVGEVTSGTFSPTLEAGIALASLKAGGAGFERYSIEIRGREIPARKVELPFVRGSVRKKTESSEEE